MALFITFEGGELSGKSTQSRLLYHRMLEEGHQAVLIHEPGTTRLGEYLRSFLLSENRLSYKAELLLFAAARAEIVETVIKPNLGSGVNVVCDRFMHSTVAYQGYGRGLSVDTIHELNEFAVGGCTPHLTALMDIPAALTVGRANPQIQLPYFLQAAASGHRLDDEAKRKFEQLPEEFHQRVREGYLEMAQHGPERWLLVNGQDSMEDNAALIWSRVQPLLTAEG